MTNDKRELFGEFLLTKGAITEEANRIPGKKRSHTMSVRILANDDHKSAHTFIELSLSKKDASLIHVYKTLADKSAG